MNTDTLRDDARAALQSAQFSRAADLCGAWTRQQPADPEAWFLLGAALDGCGNAEQALQAFGKAETLQPDLTQAINAQAAMLSALGRWQDALQAFHRALGNKPGDPQILTNIGIVLETIGREDEALQSYDTALNADPQHLGALNNRGSLLLKRGQAEAALQDHLRFVAAAPGNPIGHYNCAETHAALLRDQDALMACDAALRLDPRHVKAHIVRGLVLAGLGRLEEARTALKTAKKMDAALFDETFKRTGHTFTALSIRNLEYVFCLRTKQRLLQCNWSGYQQFLTALARLAEPGRQPDHEPLDFFPFAHVSLATPLEPRLQFSLAQKVAAAAQEKCGAVARTPRRKDSKIRIGYVSPDFISHATSHITCRLYGLHDRRQFEVYAYSLRADDGTPLRRQVEQGCNVFRECTEWPTRKIVDAIRDDGIDILVNLAGYTDGARTEIFAWRPAPINVAFLGSNGNSGATFMDYWITDPVASPPGHQQYCSEKIVRLAGNCMTYNDQLVIADPGRRADHGLPEHAFVFCCFNSGYKIEPTVFAAWMQLLKDVSGSVLWLFAGEPVVADNLTREAVRHGIDPNRLVFARTLPLAEHIGRYRLADLFLDTLYCNAQTTSLDALWAGLPVLTCPGSTYASRNCASQMTHLGLPELITQSVQHYTQRACELARDPRQLSAIRQKLMTLRAASPMFRSETIVRDLERAYTRMWQRYQAGQEPVDFNN